MTRLSAPTDLLARWTAEAPAGRALDLGAGFAESARWLAAQGFRVEAVDQRPIPAAAGVTAHLADLRSFPLGSQRYALINAAAVLHFLRPSELPTLAERLQTALVPGGVLLAEVFTTDDPGLHACRQAGLQAVERDTYLFADEAFLIHYFAPGELRHLFPRLELLAYEEYRQADPDDPAGYRAGAALAARRPAEA